MSGLESDGWWRGCSAATARTCRDWVRGPLLADPRMSDGDCDRFVASLSEAKREALIRRAVNGHGAKGF